MALEDDKDESVPLLQKTKEIWADEDPLVSAVLRASIIALRAQSIPAKLCQVTANQRNSIPDCHLRKSLSRMPIAELSFQSAI